MFWSIANFVQLLFCLQLITIQKKLNINMICTGTNPKSIGVGGVEKVAGSSDNFQYKTLTCTNEPIGSGPGSYTAITIPGDPRTYDYSNSITTGDFMIAGFLAMVLIALMCWGIYLLTFRRKY